jgi:hypothetical protein
MNAMSDNFELLALERIAAVFNLPVEQLRPEWTFGTDLTSSFRSDFARNEYDVLGDDVRDVADKPALRLINSGELEIHTVREYCEFMATMSRDNPKEVKFVLTSKSGRYKRSGWLAELRRWREDFWNS